MKVTQWLLGDRGKDLLSDSSLLWYFGHKGWSLNNSFVGYKIMYIFVSYRHMLSMELSLRL